MSKLMIVGVVAVIAVAGCKATIHVDVRCQSIEGPAIECEAEENQGKAEAETCWDMSITCGNGAIVTAPRSCVTVKDGGTSKIIVPTAKLTGLDKCGGTNPTMNITSMTIDGQAVEATSHPLPTSSGAGSAK